MLNNTRNESTSTLIKASLFYICIFIGTTIYIRKNDLIEKKLTLYERLKVYDVDNMKIESELFIIVYF